MGDIYGGHFMSITSLGGISRAVITGASLFAFASMGNFSTAQAADFGGDCCADLEERVAVLESTTARKGNRKVSLTISGHVNQALLLWDDGDESDVYVVGNANDDLSMFRFEGDAKIAPGWTTGFTMEIEVASASSGDVSQTDDDAANEIGISEVSMYIESERYGKVTWGFAGQPSDGAPEMDLSGAHYAGYAAIADVGGGFQWRMNNGLGLSGVTLGGVFDDLNGDTFNIIRYDTPTIAGFTLSVAWGEDDLWDVALAYEKELGAFEVAAAIGYTENRDNDDDGPLNNDTLAGSVSILHTPTGLNVTFAAGERQFNNTPGRADADFYYVKAGIFRRYNSLGKTAIYGEYGQYNDMFYNDGADGGDATDISTALTGNGAAVIIGSEATVWGVGLVQYVDAAAMQLFLAYRHHELDLDAAGGLAVNGLEDFDTVLAGARIEF